MPKPKSTVIVRVAYVPKPNSNILVGVAPKCLSLNRKLENI